MLDWLTLDDREAVYLSLSVASRSVVFRLPVAIAIAYALVCGRFIGRTLLDGFVHLPLVMPPSWSDGGCCCLSVCVDRWERSSRPSRGIR